MAATHHIDIAHEDVEAFWETVQSETPSLELRLADEAKRQVYGRYGTFENMEREISQSVAKTCLIKQGNVGDKVVFLIANVPRYRVTLSRITPIFRNAHEAKGGVRCGVCLYWTEGDKVLEAEPFNQGNAPG